MSFPSSTLVLRAILTRLPKNSLFHCFSPGPPSPEQVTSSSAEQVKETTKTKKIIGSCLRGSLLDRNKKYVHSLIQANPQILLIALISLLLPGPTAAQTFQWPLSPVTTIPNITQDYACKGPSSDPIFDRCFHDNQYHTGIDMTSTSFDQNIYAAEEGMVVPGSVRNDCKQGERCNGGFGNTVIIQHANGIYSQYGHMQKDSILVTGGQWITKGQKIGVMGNTGDSDYGIHLHFELKNNSNLGAGYTLSPPDVNGYFDPWKYLASTGMSSVPVKVVNATGINIRRGPSTAYTAFTTANFNQSFVAFAATGGWYRVYLPCSNSSCAGWIAGTVSGTIFSVEDSSLNQVEVKDTNTSGLFVKPSPGSSSSLDKIWDGQRFVAFGTPQSGANCSSNWYQLYLPAVSHA